MTNAAQIPEKFDVVIIGGGPAGISAALWCDDLGLKCCLIESGGSLGGQLLYTYNGVSNYLGLDVEDGAALARRFVRSIANRSVDIRLNTVANSIDVKQNLLTTTDGQQFDYRYLIVATGLGRRKLGIEGEDRLIGRGVLKSGVGEIEKVRGQRVIIIGGGDSAVENAVLLSGVASDVTLIHRGNNLRARREFVDQIDEKDNLAVLLMSEVTGISGDDQIRSVMIRSLTDGSIRSLGVDRLLIRIGYEPKTGFLPTEIALDGRGYVVVDQNGQTSDESIFAVGDVASGAMPTIQTATGTAATVVKSIKSRMPGR